MTKITEIDRKLQVKHLNDLSKASLKSNIKHSQNIQKQIDHTIVLTKIIQEDRAKLSRLENVIDMRDREIQELNSKQMDLLWDLAQLLGRPGVRQSPARAGCRAGPSPLPRAPLAPRHLPPCPDRAS